MTAPSGSVHYGVCVIEAHLWIRFSAGRKDPQQQHQFDHNNGGKPNEGNPKLLLSTALVKKFHMDARDGGMGFE